jgi:alpha-tubulin suppressor-like RCC1 family protein
VRAVAAGWQHSCALLNDGSVRCWGANERGQLGDGTNASCWTPVAVQTVTSAVEVALGKYHSCALLSDGTVKCWGQNTYRQLGDGTRIDRLTPVSVMDLP